jgi:hypothetical protein
MGGKQGIEALPQPVRLERGVRKAGLGQRAHPTFLQACPDRIEGMMAIKHRQEERLAPTATREHIGRVGRAAGSDERRHMALADHPKDPRHVSHGTDLGNRDRHEAPLLQVFSEVAS